MQWYSLFTEAQIMWSQSWAWICNAPKLFMNIQCIYKSTKFNNHCGTYGNKNVSMSCVYHNHMASFMIASRKKIEALSTLLALCKRNPSVESTHERPVMRIFDISELKRQESSKKNPPYWYWTIDVSFYIRPNELLYKQSSCQWSETACIAHVTSL